MLNSVLILILVKLNVKTLHRPYSGRVFTLHARVL